jgi:hypothetical protein
MSTTLRSLTIPRIPGHRSRRLAPGPAFRRTRFRLRPGVEAAEDRALLSTFLFSNPVDTPRGIAARDSHGASIPDLARPRLLPQRQAEETPWNALVTLGQPAPPSGTSGAKIIGDFNGDGTDDMLEFAATGSILYRQGVPGQAGAFEPSVALNPVFSSRAIPPRRATNGPIMVLQAVGPAGITIRPNAPAQTTVFDWTQSNGVEDALVGNRGDWAQALFEGYTVGLRPISVEEDPCPPHPTGLPSSVLTGSALPFDAAAERQAVEFVAVSLSSQDDTATSRMGASSSSPAPPQLVALRESSLPLAATALTLTAPVSGEDPGPEAAQREAVATTLAVHIGLSTGQAVPSTARRGGWPAGETEGSDEPAVGAQPAVVAPWQRFVMGLDNALEELDRDNAGGMIGPAWSGDRTEPSPRPYGPALGSGTGWRSVRQRPSGADGGSAGVVTLPARARAIEAELEGLGTDRDGFDPREIDRSIRDPDRDEPGLAGVCLAVLLLAGRWRALRGATMRQSVPDPPGVGPVRRRPHSLI